MGNLLRSELQSADWRIVNDTTLPVVCFVDVSREGGSAPIFLKGIAQRIVQGGGAWLSTTSLSGQTVLRACITHYNTQADDVRALVYLVSEARTELYRQMKNCI
jgi:hypothetical protein